MNKEEIKKSFYAIIPADVRYDSDLKPNAKLLYGEITALCNERGYCWASNDYFAKLYNVKTCTITTWVSNLVDKGYINRKILYKEGSKEVAVRILMLSKSLLLPDKNNLPYPINIDEGHISKDSNSEGTSTNPALLDIKLGAPLGKSKENTTVDNEYITKVIYSDFSEYKNFIPLVEKWIAYKKSVKKNYKKNGNGLSIIIKRLIKYSDGDFKNAEEIVDTAITAGWSTIYERKIADFNKAAPKKNAFQTTGKYGGY